MISLCALGLTILNRSLVLRYRLKSEQEKQSILNKMTACHYCLARLALILEE